MYVVRGAAESPKNKKIKILRTFISLFIQKFKQMIA